MLCFAFILPHFLTLVLIIANPLEYDSSSFRSGVGLPTGVASQLKNTLQMLLLSKLFGLQKKG